MKRYEPAGEGFRNRTTSRLTANNPYEMLRKKTAAWAGLLEGLRKVGFDVSNPVDLHRYSPYPAAIPLLLEFLKQDQPDQVRLGVAQSLNVREAKPWWDEIKALYLGPNGDSTEDQLASVLSTILTREKLDDFIELAMDRANGSSRAMMMRALKRSRDPRAASALQALRTDPAVAVEIDAIFRGLSRKD